MQYLWLRLKALFNEAARGEKITIDRQTNQWEQKQDELSEEDLRQRFPRARQNRG